MAKKVSKKVDSPLDESQELLVKIGIRLKQLRIAAGYASYEQFAFRNQLDRTQVGRYERGLSDLRMTSFLRILAALKVSLPEFFEEGFDKK